MEERLMRVQCPQCGAGFRVNPDAVPLEGASAVCKKCGRRFSIRKPVPEDGWGNAAAATAFIEPSRESLFTCPRCGHRQIQPYNCYACGAVITPRESAASAPATPDAAGPSSGVASPLDLVMGEIVVRTRFEASDWLLNFATKPRVSIDGMDHYPGWGVHAIRVPEGDCPVVIDYKYFIKYHGRATLAVQVSAAQKVYVDYRPRTSSASAGGFIRKASSAEGLLWRIKRESERPAGSGMYSRKAVIISLLVLGPLGLYQLWKSDAFSTRTKIVITAVVVFFYYWIFSKFSLPKGSFLTP